MSEIETNNMSRTLWFDHCFVLIITNTTNPLNTKLNRNSKTNMAARTCLVVIETAWTRSITGRHTEKFVIVCKFLNLAYFLHVLQTHFNFQKTNAWIPVKFNKRVVTMLVSCCHLTPHSSSGGAILRVDGSQWAELFQGRASEDGFQPFLKFHRGRSNSIFGRFSR